MNKWLVVFKSNNFYLIDPIDFTKLNKNQIFQMAIETSDYDPEYSIFNFIDNEIRVLYMGLPEEENSKIVIGWRSIKELDNKLIIPLPPIEGIGLAFDEKHTTTEKENSSSN